MLIVCIGCIQEIINKKQFHFNKNSFGRKLRIAACFMVSPIPTLTLQISLRGEGNGLKGHLTLSRR